MPKNFHKSTSFRFTFVALLLLFFCAPVDVSAGHTASVSVSGTPVYPGTGYTVTGSFTNNGPCDAYIDTYLYYRVNGADNYWGQAGAMVSAGQTWTTSRSSTGDAAGTVMGFFFNTNSFYVCGNYGNFAQSNIAGFTVSYPAQSISVSSDFPGMLMYCNNASCNSTYPYNSSVGITYGTALGYHFTNWTGDCSGGDSCSVTMNQARSVVAHFAANAVNCVGSWGSCSNGSKTYTITTNASGGGTACPYSNGATQSCGTNCVGSWGACSNGSQTYTITTNASGGGAACSYSNGATQGCGTAGSCGSSNGGNFSSAPTSGLCNSGSASALSSLATTWSWSCSGTGGGVSVGCSANKKVDGVCSSTLNVCSSGSSSNSWQGSYYPYNYYWDCLGSNTGSNVSCSQAIPPPTNVSAGSCPSPGTSGSLSWSLPSGYSQSYFRARDTTTGTDLTTPNSPRVWRPEDVSDSGTSVSFTTIPGHSYDVWVHTRMPGASDNSNGRYSAEVRRTFTCVYPSPTVNLQVRGSGTSTWNDTSASVNYGGSVDLSWSSANTNSGNSCTASGSWSGAQASSNSSGVAMSALSTPAGATYTYTITCDGPGGQAVDSVTVTQASQKFVIAARALGPTGSGSLSGTGALLFNFSNCPSDPTAASCNPSAIYNYNGTAVLTATVNSGSNFNGWTGGVCAVSSVAGETPGRKCTIANITSTPATPVANFALIIPAVTLTPSSVSLISGSPQTLTWSSTNASSCSSPGTSGGSAIPGFSTSGSKNLNDSQSVSPTSNTTYGITCTNSGGSASATSVITLYPGTPTVSASTPACSSGAGRINFTFSQASEGQTTTYSLFRSAPNSTLAAGGSSLAQQTSTLGALSASDTGLVAGATYQYQLLARGPGGDRYSSIVSATSSVSCPNVIISLLGRKAGTGSYVSGPITVNYGDSVDLSWVGAYATACTASSNPSSGAGSWSGSKSTTSGNDTNIGPLTATQYIYTVSCTGTGASGSSSVTFNINPSTLTISSFSASPTAVDDGALATLTGALGGTATGVATYTYTCESGVTPVATTSATYPCVYSNSGSATTTKTANLSVTRTDYATPVTSSASVTVRPRPSVTVARNVSVSITPTLTGTIGGTVSYSSQSCGGGTLVSSNGFTGLFTCSYSSSGTYTASETATKGSATKTGFVTVIVQ